MKYNFTNFSTALVFMFSGLLGGCDPAYVVFMEVNLPLTSSLTVPAKGQADRDRMFQTIEEVAAKHGLEKSKENPGNAWFLFEREYDHEVSHFHIHVEEVEGLGRWRIMVTDFLTTEQSERSKKVVTDLIQGLEKNFGKGTVTLKEIYEFP